MNTTELLVIEERLQELVAFAEEQRVIARDIEKLPDAAEHWRRMSVWLNHAASVIEFARIEEDERLGIERTAASVAATG